MIVLNEHSPLIPEKVLRSSLKISLMEKSDIQESANVLSVSMLDANLHVAVLQGKGERERQEIKKIGFKKPELVGETGFNSSPKTKGVLFRGNKSKIHKQETTSDTKHGVEKVVMEARMSVVKNYERKTK